MYRGGASLVGGSRVFTMGPRVPPNECVEKALLDTPHDSFSHPICGAGVAGSLIESIQAKTDLCNLVDLVDSS